MQIIFEIVFALFSLRCVKPREANVDKRHLTALQALIQKKKGPQESCSGEGVI